MIACLFKNGSSYSINDQRSYDAWGNIRAGNTTGDPKARYVANLGHLADDESGLTYMRARYYEPSSGRFVSQDPAMDGGNWYVYCDNDPVCRRDFDGKVSLVDLLGGAADEVYQKFVEVQQAKVTLSWAENAIVRALSKWSKNVGEHILEAAYGMEFAVIAREGSKSGLGIQLTGIGGRLNIGIVVQGEEIIVKTYNSLGRHRWDNISVPLLK